MSVKHHYDRKHQFLFMKKNDYTFIRLHRDYKISITNILDKKYSHQFVSFFKIFQKIDVLVYRLNLFSHWRIHSMLNVTQLKSTFSLTNDFYRRHKFNNSNFIFVENDIFIVKFFQIERLLNKRQIKTRESKYLIRWKNCESKKNVWKSLFELRNAMKLIHEYEHALKIVVSLSNRLQKFFDVSFDNITNFLTNVLVVTRVIATRLKKSFVVLVEQKFVVVILSRKLFANFFVVVESIVNSSSTQLTNDFIVVKSRKSFANDFVDAKIVVDRLTSINETIVLWKTLAILSTSIFIVLSIAAISSIFSRRFARFLFSC